MCVFFSGSSIEIQLRFEFVLIKTRSLERERETAKSQEKNGKFPILRSIASTERKEKRREFNNRLFHY